MEAVAVGAVVWQLSNEEDISAVVVAEAIRAAAEATPTNSVLTVMVEADFEVLAEFITLGELQHFCCAGRRCQYGCDLEKGLHIACTCQ